MQPHMNYFSQRQLRRSGHKNTLPSPLCSSYSLETILDSFGPRVDTGGICVTHLTKNNFIFHWFYPIYLPSHSLPRLQA